MIQQEIDYKAVLSAFDELINIISTGWCQYDFATTSTATGSQSTRSVRDDDATCFCLSGAIQRMYYLHRPVDIDADVDNYVSPDNLTLATLTNYLTDYIRVNTPFSGIISYNDYPPRFQSDVISLLQDAKQSYSWRWKVRELIIFNQFK